MNFNISRGIVACELVNRIIKITRKLNVSMPPIAKTNARVSANDSSNSDKYNVCERSDTIPGVEFFLYYYYVSRATKRVLSLLMMYPERHNKFWKSCHKHSYSHFSWHKPCTYTYILTFVCIYPPLRQWLTNIVWHTSPQNTHAHKSLYRCNIQSVYQLNNNISAHI